MGKRERPGRMARTNAPCETPRRQSVAQRVTIAQSSSEGGVWGEIGEEIGLVAREELA